MTFVFYLSGAVAIVATALAVTRLNAVHALLYLIVSLLGIAVAFYTLGAPFVAALEVIVYAGAIIVLFLFVVMMLNLGPTRSRRALRWAPGGWIGPAILAFVLLVELLLVLGGGAGASMAVKEVSPRDVSVAMYGPYLLGAELASMLLLSGMVGAYHLGRRDRRETESGGE